MPELAQVDPFSSVGSSAPGLPPIDLPQDEPRRRQRLQVEVRPDPYADHPLWGEHGAPVGESYAEHPLWGEQAEKKPSRDIGTGESAFMGVRDALTFGAYPAIRGAVSGGKSLLGGKGTEEAAKAYREMRDAAREEQESAYTQNPKSYMGGQFIGAIATPMGAGVRAATMAGRLLQAGRAGAIGGGLYGAGGALSEGGGVGDVASGAGLGAVTGAALGTAGHGLLEGAGQIARRGKDIAQGLFNPSEVAERQLSGAMRDARDAGQLGLDPAAARAAVAHNLPVYNIDVGGERTQRIGRALSNLSPEAAATMRPVLEQRATERAESLHNSVESLFGGPLDAKLDRERLENAASVFHGPRYTRAYAAGDRPIGTSPEMQRLMGIPAVEDAMRAAITRGQNRAGAEGRGAFNPGVNVTPDGRLQFRPGKGGIPTYPNIQYWDYVQREMRAAAEQAKRAGDKEHGAAIGSLRAQLNRELDAHVPEFNEARRGAAAFFGAEDASDAGRKFVMRNADPREARRMIAKFSPPERELFARAFADELTQSVMRNPSWRNIQSVFTVPRAREKIETALGRDRARELEVVTRVHQLARSTEDAVLGNSTSARQLADMMRLAGSHGAGGALGTAGAIGGLELLKEGDYEPKHLLAGALIYGALRSGARHIDARVANEMARMLMSNDPAIMQRGARTVSRSRMFEALRRGTEAGSRVTAHDLGPSGVSAATAAILEHILTDVEPEHHNNPGNQELLSQQLP
jgi:hypothetical protein